MHGADRRDPLAFRGGRIVPAASDANTSCALRKKETFESSIDWQENRYGPAIPHLNHVLLDRLFYRRRSRTLRRDGAKRCG
jgi:hypothetical protein